VNLVKPTRLRWLSQIAFFSMFLLLLLRTLGALPALLSRAEILGPVKNPEPCDNCTRCLLRWRPTSPEAIYRIPAEVIETARNIRQVKRSYLDPSRCAGCGECE